MEDDIGIPGIPDSKIGHPNLNSISQQAESLSKHMLTTAATTNTDSHERINTGNNYLFEIDNNSRLEIRDCDIRAETSLKYCDREKPTCLVVNW